MKLLGNFLLASSLLVSSLLPAGASTDALNSEDPVLNAMVDEMQRSKNKLRFETHPAPYFAAYYIKEVDEISITSCLGSPADIERSKTRTVLPDIRLGDYDLDSSNPILSRQNSADQIGVDDDYTAIRRRLWLHTDRDYKFGVRTLEWKKAFLETNNVPDRLPDLTREEPTVKINEKLPLSADEKALAEEVEKLSRVFASYPDLQKSKVTLVVRANTIWHVNSEGGRVRDSERKCFLKFYGTAQAEDGMPIDDYQVLSAKAPGDLPPLSEKLAIASKFAEEISAISKAKKAEDYCGPVLFKGQGAAEFFGQILAPNLGFAEDYIGDESFRNPLKNTLGRKLLPDHMSLHDNPGLESFAGQTIVGGYRFDDEGMPGQKITLIENGRLKDFCRSRIPTRHARKSNGHSVGGHGIWNVLELTSTRPLSPDKLEKRMKEVAKDAGLDYILVIEKLNDDYQLHEYPSTEMKKAYYFTPSYSRQPSDPIVAYRLYLKDGRKELLRGLEFNYVSLRAFRDIQAVGDDAAPFIIEPDGRARHLITPSYLIGELDLRPVKPEHSTLPVVPSPIRESLGQ